LRPDPQQAQAWHNAQWAAVAAAWAAASDIYHPPKEPRAPWGLGRELPAAYAAVLACRAGEAQTWDALEQDSRGQVRYCTQLLTALYERDKAQLGKLTAELDQRRAGQRTAIEQYQAARQRTDDAITALRAAWEARLPAASRSWDFDLSAAVRTARGGTAATPLQLHAYYDHNYARLRRRYLSWASDQTDGQAAIEPAAPATASEDDEPAPAAPAAPPGSEHLRSSLQALEAALVARNALETQALADGRALQRYAPADGRIETQLPDLLPDQRRASSQYRQPRIAVAQARLALFSRVDALLTPAEDVLQTAVTREWHALWPDCDIETNIYASAGLPPRQAAAGSDVAAVDEQSDR
jgi:hypothetical protein